MVNKRSCLDLISQTRLSAPDPDSAYVLRARLQRSILMVSRWIASDLGKPLPALPDEIEYLASQDDKASGIIAICNDVLNKSKTLCQPSESLDDRWKTGWKDVLSGLVALEMALESYDV